MSQTPKHEDSDRAERQPVTYLKEPVQVLKRKNSIK